MSTTVLITGANGFIGSHCTKLIESAGQKSLPSTSSRARRISLCLASKPPPI